jgi:hypothetical protein
MVNEAARSKYNGAAGYPPSDGTSAGVHGSQNRAVEEILNELLVQVITSLAVIQKKSKENP